MEGISDIKIVGIDKKRPPQMQKEPYINLYFTLSHKVVSGWCSDFNQIASRYQPAGSAAPVPFPTLRFKHDSTELTDESLALLDQVVAALKARPRMRVELAAHTDASGNPAYNMDLSTRRARAVLELLKTKGIDEDRLEPKGYGDTRPLADHRIPQGADLNRRIEFIVIE